MSSFKPDGYIFDTGLLSSGTNRLRYDLSNTRVKLCIVQVVNYTAKCTVSIIPKGAPITTTDTRGCLICQEPLIPGRSIQWQGEINLGPDEEIRVTFYNATANDRYYVVMRFERF